MAESNIVMAIAQTIWVPETLEFQSALNEHRNPHPKNSMLQNIVSPTPRSVDAGETCLSKSVTLEVVNSASGNEKYTTAQSTADNIGLKQLEND